MRRSSLMGESLGMRRSPLMGESLGMRRSPLMGEKECVIFSFAIEGSLCHVLSCIPNVT